MLKIDATKWTDMSNGMALFELLSVGKMINYGNYNKSIKQESYQLLLGKIKLSYYILINIDIKSEHVTSSSTPRQNIFHQSYLNKISELPHM